MVAPAAGHLGDTVDATDHQTSIRTAHAVQKQPEPLIGPERPHMRRHLVAASLDPLARLEQIHATQRTESTKNHNLENNTGDDDAVAVLQQVVLVASRGGGDAATDGLDDEARDVGGDEEQGVPLRGDDAEVRVDGAHDVLDGQVQADADEGGPEYDGDDLQLEAVLVPGVGGQEDAADVAGHLEDATGADGDRVAPRLAPDADAEGEEGAETVADGHEDVDALVGVVPEGGVLDTANLGHAQARARVVAGPERQRRRHHGCRGCRRGHCMRMRNPVRCGGYECGPCTPGRMPAVVVKKRFGPGPCPCLCVRRPGRKLRSGVGSSCSCLCFSAHVVEYRNSGVQPFKGIPIDAISSFSFFAQNNSIDRNDFVPTGGFLW